jgi:hypothetical protein
MPADVISERLNGDDNTWYPRFLSKDEFEKFRQTFCGALAELAQQFAVIEKESAQDFGDGENIFTVGNRIENRLLEVMADLNYFLVVA